MARLQQNFVRFRGDMFTIQFETIDGGNLELYKAEWTVYTKSKSGDVVTITKYLTITTDSGFNAPAQGYFIGDGITIEENIISVDVPVAVYDSNRLGTSTHEMEFEHQLRIWDPEDNTAIAAQGTWDLRKPAAPATIT